MDNWVVKNNLKYAHSEFTLKAICKNIKENNKNGTPQEQKQNMLDFLNLCPQLMKVFENEDLELLCDEIVNKNHFILAHVNKLRPLIDPFYFNVIALPGPSGLIALNNKAGDRFRNYLTTYDHDKKVKLRNVLYLYLTKNDTDLLLSGSSILDYRDDFCAKKYQEDVELCSKSLINIFKLKSTNSGKQIFLSKLFRWKSDLVTLELFLDCVCYSGIGDFCRQSSDYYFCIFVRFCYVH